MIEIRDRRGWRPAAVVAALLVGVLSGPPARAQAPAQTAADDGADAVDRIVLRERVRERFDVVGLRDGNGFALVPRIAIPDVRLVEIRDGVIAINGEAVSGEELRRRLPQSAPLVLQLSYLDGAGRATILQAPPPAEAPPLEAPDGPDSPDSPASAGDDRTATDARRLRRSQDIFRLGGNVFVDRNQLITGDVVVIGGNSRIDGIVTGDAVVIAGTLRLGREAEVRGDVVVVASRLDRAPGARIDGQLVNVGVGNPLSAIDFGGAPFVPFRFRASPLPRVMSLFGTLLRLGLMMMLTWLALAVARRSVHAIADRAAAEPLKAGLVGVLVELLFVPVLVTVTVLLAVSIVGIPLLVLVPVAVLIFGFVLVAGFAGIAMRIGQWIGERFGSSRLDGYAAAAVGTVVLLTLALAARFAYLPGGLVSALGVTLSVMAFCVEYVAWTVGLGAAVLVKFAPQQGEPTPL